MQKNKYKLINSQQIKNRSEIAYKDKQILKYAEECIRTNNPSKEAFLIDNEGRKKEICQKFCELAFEIDSKQFIKDVQKEFIKKLSK